MIGAALFVVIYGLLNYCKPSFHYLMILTGFKIAAIIRSLTEVSYLRTPDELFAVLCDPIKWTVF